MGTRIAVSCAVLSTFGVATWIASSDRTSDPLAASVRTDRDAAVQETAEGSVLPCDVPLVWRVTRVDEEFGFSAAEARAAVQEAAWVWEQASSTPLFRHDSIEGFPIRLVFDARQARAQERRRRRAILDSQLDTLTAAREELALRNEEHARERAALEARLSDLDRRIEEHNAEVAGWNRQGGLPEGRAREIQAVGDALDSEKREVEREVRRLDRGMSSLERDRRRLDRRLHEHARRVEGFAREFPPTYSQWGLYREAIHDEAGETRSVSREIRIFRFQSQEDLVAVAAHELGHALGLGHSATTGALMSGERDRVGGSLGPTALAPTDVEAFRALCPDLAAAEGDAQP